LLVDPVFNAGEPGFVALQNNLYGRKLLKDLIEFAVDIFKLSVTSAEFFFDNVRPVLLQPV
jgi:hypothetical protein